MMCAFEEATFAERLYGPLDLAGQPVDLADGRRLTRVEIVPVDTNGIGLLILAVGADGETLRYDARCRGLDARVFQPGHNVDRDLEDALYPITGPFGVYYSRWVDLLAHARRIDPKSERKRTEFAVMQRYDEGLLAKRLEHAEKIRRLIDLCGMSQAEAATILGVSHDTMRQRLSGRRPSPTPDRDVKRLLQLWRRIENGDLAGLPVGAVRRAEILAFVRQAKY